MTPPNIQHHHYNNCVGSLNTRLSCMVAPKENVFQDREKMVTGGWTMNGRGDNWVKWCGNMVSDLVVKWYDRSQYMVSRWELLEDFGICNRLGKASLMRFKGFNQETMGRGLLYLQGKHPLCWAGVFNIYSQCGNMWVGIMRYAFELYEICVHRCTPLYQTLQHLKMGFENLWYFLKNIKSRNMVLDHC